MNDFHLIARIVSAGRDGYVKIFPLVEFDVQTLIDKIVYLDFWGKKKKFIVEDISKTKNSIFIKFLNFVEDREIQLLLDRKIFLIKSDAESIVKNDFNIEQLIGLEVFRESNKLGVIRDIFKTPANHVLEIMDSSGKEILIPFIKNFFDEINVADKRISLKKDAALQDDEN